MPIVKTQTKSKAEAQLTSTHMVKAEGQYARPLTASGFLALGYHSRVFNVLQRLVNGLLLPELAIWCSETVELDSPSPLLSVEQSIIAWAVASLIPIQIEAEQGRR